MQEPVCTDDFGHAVYWCHHGAGYAFGPEYVTVGAIVPGVRATYIVAGAAGLAAHKESGRAFAESEANCNTCRHLDRTQHPKNVAHLLHGKCKADPGKGIMTFHADDFMGMPCYVPRWGFSIQAELSGAI